MNSMTGFGRATLSLPDHLVLLEVFSVNKKGLEIVFSAPKEWQAFERQANSFLKKSLERGRIRISISVEQTKVDENAQGLFDKDVMEGDLSELKSFIEEKGFACEVTPELILQLAQARNRESGLPKLEDILSELEKTLSNATLEMIAMRKEEGSSIFHDLEERTNSLEEMTKRMEEGSKEMASEWKSKLLERLNKADLSLNSEDDRVLKEVALFAEKCDVSEEISRLRSHLGQIRETVAQEGSIGRKLEFLLQEVSRELNTFCSKSTRTQCTSIGLDARAEVEKMREQSMNVE
ncbi:MAG: DUF1732 domain-containing protein [Opitutae bacterium]|jgi:uncharacterized protein (TIGR00255 family)|nr:DUF1732 domain-containing protein [Opitutae bacterium]